MPPKTIHLIRHGESTFNALYTQTGVDPMLFDAPLTPRGVEQVAVARLAFRDRPVEVVLTSPLTRALQTATGLFADHPSRPPIIVDAGHRERLESSCDRGRAPRELMADFPGLRFDHLAETWWHEEGAPGERGFATEPAEVMVARLLDFVAALRDRRERHIAVVGHGTFFHHLTGRWMDNCESVVWDGAVAGAAIEPAAS